METLYARSSRGITLNVKIVFEKIIWIKMHSSFIIQNINLDWDKFSDLQHTKQIHTKTKIK